MEVHIPNLFIKSLGPTNNMNDVWELINKMVCQDLGIPFTTLHKSLKDDEEGFQYSTYMFVIRADDIKRIKSIVEQTCLISKRHYIVIKIVEKLRHSIAAGLASLIKKYSSTTVFIFIDNQYHHVPLCIQSLLFRVAIKGGGESGDGGGGACKQFVVQGIQKLYDTFKKPSCTVTYYKDLRSYCIKISAGCIPISKFAKYILDWKADAEIVCYLANLDLALKKTSKEIFALEYYIQSIVEHCCCKNDL